MRIARLFVTGTDTGVGKTVVAGCLAAACPGAVALKAVATGADPPPGDDALWLARATGGEADVGMAWAPPVSPHRAAALEGRPLDVPALLAWIRARQAPVTLVEGVGGWEVPLTWTFRVRDLAAHLGWPVLVVAANRLGVLNHTLLTTAAVQSAGLALAGVVLNDVGPGAADEDEARRWNLEDLRLLLPGVPVFPLGPLAALDRVELARAGASLWASLEGHHGPAGSPPGGG